MQLVALLQVRLAKTVVLTDSSTLEGFNSTVQRLFAPKRASLAGGPLYTLILCVQKHVYVDTSWKLAAGRWPDPWPRCKIHPQSFFFSVYRRRRFGLTRLVTFQKNTLMVN